MLLHDAFDFQAISRGDHCFAQCEGRSLSYAEGRARSLAIAAAFLALGLGKGDRIAILARNSLDSLPILYAASRIGVVPVPLNYRLAPVEWAELLHDSRARLILADPAYQEALDNALAGAPASSASMRRSLESGGSWEPLEALLVPSPGPLPRADILDEDIVLQMYTSGTTGKAKGAMLSHRALVHNIGHSILATPYRLGPGERSLIALPLFHIAAISTALTAASLGACLVIHRDVDPTAIVKALANGDIAVASMVPAIMQFILTGVPGIEEMRFPSLKFLGYGASPIAEPLLRRAMAVFQCHLAQGYGMTEAAGSATMLTEADHRRAMEGRPDLLLSAGKAIPGAAVRIVRPDGSEAETGEVGEILIRGEQLMTGYWNMPEATAEALKDGWLHTGDAGRLDEEGYLYVRDRIKDMIVSWAENIYPVEIETVLFDHPDVSDVSVIGVPDTKWGETVMAVVVARPGATPTAEELDAFCRARLGGFKVPRKYEFVDGLPRNAGGKVLKRQLREHYWRGQERRIA